LREKCPKKRSFLLGFREHAWLSRRRLGDFGPLVLSVRRGEGGRSRGVSGEAESWGWQKMGWKRVVGKERYGEGGGGEI